MRFFKSKEEKELDGIINRLEMNMSNNYKDNAQDNLKELEDIGAREFLVLAILAAAVLFMGLYPKPFTDVMDPSVAELLKHVAQTKLP